MSLEMSFEISKDSQHPSAMLSLPPSWKSICKLNRGDGEVLLPRTLGQELKYDSFKRFAIVISKIDLERPDLMLLSICSFTCYFTWNSYPKRDSTLPRTLTGNFS